MVRSGFADDVGVRDGENSGVVEPAGSGDIVGLYCELLGRTVWRVWKCSELK